MINEDGIYPFNKTIIEEKSKEILENSSHDDHRLESLEGNNSMIYILEHFPVLKIDPKLNESINYTNHSIDDFRMPYPAFFINKAFETEVGVIAGMYVYDRLEILRLLLQEAIKDNKNDHDYVTYLKKSIKEQERLRERPDNDITQNTIVCCIVVTDEENIVLEFNIYSLMHQEVELNSGFSKSENKALMKDKLKYSVGIANLLTANIDFNHPQNPKNDVRVIPYYPNGKDRQSKKTNHSVIRVFGKLRKELDHFNNEIRKRGHNNIAAIIVRGHWRRFKNERFKNKRGETIWIMPFVRGKDRELVSKVIEVKE